VPKSGTKLRSVAAKSFCIAGLLPALVLALTIRFDCQGVQSLSQVKKVYVAEFSGQPAEQLRQSVLKNLRKSRRYQVADSAAEADAIVTGTGQIWIKGYLTTNSRSPSVNRQPVYGGYLSVEVAAKDGVALWSYLVTPSKSIWAGIIDDLTGNLVKEMVAASDAESGTATTSTPRLEKTSVSGAGATFPAPLYRKWFQSFQRRNPAVRITYDAVGSEKGAELLAAGQVDFAASDVSSTDLGNPPLHTTFRRFATVLGAVVPIYNLGELTQDLRFTPQMLADIYLGKITKWNDPEIRKTNRNSPLPDSEIQVIHRSDGSGTTYTWSDFLSKVSPEWKTAVGTGTSLNWPVGTGAAGNAGVAAAVQQTPNSIGYVELAHAIQHQLNFGLVRNSSGQFIRASLDSVAEAARNSTSASALPSSITDPPGKAAYPIATFTWLLLPLDIQPPAKKAALVELLRWVLTDGQKECSALGYAPLPRSIAELGLQLLGDIP
jgi:phosphate transport system substrate-binding protein